MSDDGDKRAGADRKRDAGERLGFRLRREIVQTDVTEFDLGAASTRCATNLLGLACVVAGEEVGELRALAFFQNAPGNENILELRDRRLFDHRCRLTQLRSDSV